MKKFIVSILVVVIILFAVLVYRAETQFQNHQLEPASGITDVAIDKAGALQRFSDALKIQTISHDDRSNFDAATFTGFHAFLQTAYPLVHEHSDRTIINDFSLVYKLRGSNPALEPVLFMGHMDVVPVEDITLDEWTHPAFGGIIEDEIIWGRGTVDNKIGVVSLMEAMEVLLSENIRPQRDIYLAFGHDEEVGGSDGAAKIAEYFANKGIRFDYVLDEGGAVTEGLSPGVEQAVAVIGVSEKGYLNIVLTVNAPGGHSSSPPAQTALGILSRAIVRLEDNPFPADLAGINQHFEYIGTHTPFMMRLAMANQWLFSPLIKQQLLADPGTAAAIRTTTAATMSSASPKANILPTRATATVNFRILPGETIESVKQRVIELIDDDRVLVKDEYGNNPSAVSPVDSRGYRLIASTIRGMGNETVVAPYMLQGGTDAKYFYPLSANVYRFLMFRATPETLQYAHGINEQIPVDEYLQAIRFYYHLIRRSAEA